MEREEILWTTLYVLGCLGFLYAFNEMRISLLKTRNPDLTLEIHVKDEKGTELRDFFATHIPQVPGGISRAYAEFLMDEPEPERFTPENMKWWAEAEAKYKYLRADAMIKARIDK